MRFERGNLLRKALRAVPVVAPVRNHGAPRCVRASDDLLPLSLAAGCINPPGLRVH